MTMTFLTLLVSFLASFFLLFFAQPDISPLACIISSFCGYALFWITALKIKTKARQFVLSLFWFAAIQIGHLNWFFADRYVGSYIFVFVILISLCLGAVFGLFTLLLNRKLTLLYMLALASLWTIGEWGRLYIMSGFSWNPLGLPLSATLYGMQLVSLGGVFGLTFFVIFTNLMALRTLQMPLKMKSLWPLLSVALIPYIFGFSHLSFHSYKLKKHLGPDLSVVLVQTNLSPEQKCALPGMYGDVFSPIEQWKSILELIAQHKLKPIDLIVLSEGVVPYGTEAALFTLGDISKAFEEVLQQPLLFDKEILAGNASFAHVIADYFDADLIAGLEDFDEDPFRCYNAALFFQPQLRQKNRYAKRVLVPLGEYIPFKWCKKFLASWGIEDSFTAGQKASVFAGKAASIGVSICYEETYGHLMRENRLQGATILANLTNDVWYPQSRLPVVHYVHGRLRAVELGVPVVRACNTGVTCGIDSLGRTIASLECEKKGQKCAADALHVTLPSYTYTTLYTLYGDRGVISLCSLFLAMGLAMGLIGFVKNRKLR